MTFGVDLCPSTILDVYGYPQVIAEGSTLLLLYPNHGLRFNLDMRTHRVEVVALHPLDYIDQHFPASETQNWTSFADILSEPCIDSLSH